MAMLHLAHKVAGVTVSGTDGDIGTLEDFYFEEPGWTVRYLVVDASGKRVLVSPASVQNGWGRSGVRVNLTRQAVLNGPHIDSAAGAPSGHLDSVKQTTGYHIHARNGEIGHVDDFLIGDDSWRIRYLLVDTSNWIGGRSVIVSSDALEKVDKTDKSLYVAADRDTIANAPALESIEAALSRTETGPPFSII
jgi:PRC-barrel domain